MPDPLTAPILTRRCACGHRVHGTPCEMAVTVAGVDGGDRPCGCPPTCPMCRNWTFIVVRAGEGGDEKQTPDCPRGCADRVPS